MSVGLANQVPDGGISHMAGSAAADKVMASDPRDPDQSRRQCLPTMPPELMPHAARRACDLVSRFPAFQTPLRRVLRCLAPLVACLFGEGSLYR